MLSSTLNSPSSQTETIDMEDDRTPAEVDPGSLLQTDPKSVGSVSAPSGQFPQEPKEQYPSPTDISITVPDPTYSESKPSCDTQRRPEFIQICKDNYRTAYSSGYQGSYRELYTAQYRASFASSAKEAYIKARNAAHPESTEQGLQTGAVDQGLLNGYAQRYPSAASEAFASGKASFVARRTLSYRPIVRSAKLVESVNDGIFLPGEPVQLQIVLDNIGLKGVAAGDLKVEIKTTKGLKDVSTMERLLPEMQAATLLTLNNVVKGTIDGTLSGSPLLVDGILSRKVGENFEELAQFNISASLRFPIELSKVDISTRLSLNAWVNVPFTFTNPSSQKSSERTVFLSSAPTSIEINNPRGVKIPGIEPGQTKTINIAIRPGVWVGEGQNIDFVAKIIGQGDQVIGTQNLTKAISINRSAALIPVDTSNKPVPSARFKVRAGGRATVSLLYRYLDKQNQRMGPFQVSALTSSDPRIGIALNTPISYNFGAAYPNQQDQKLTFTYNIPADLKGRSVWVAAELKEGGSVWQRQQIWLDVE